MILKLLFKTDTLAKEKNGNMLKEFWMGIFSMKLKNIESFFLSIFLNPMITCLKKLEESSTILVVKKKDVASILPIKKGFDLLAGSQMITFLVLEKGTILMAKW